MNKKEFEKVSGYNDIEYISINQLENLKPRTLVYGFTSSRDTFHLYIEEKDGEPCFFRVIYDFDGVIKSSASMTEIKFSECVPDKRVYPDASDYEFCSHLVRHINVPFTNFEGREARDFHGKKFEELIDFDLDLFNQFEISDYLIDEFCNINDIDYRESIKNSIKGQVDGFFKDVLLRSKSIEEAGKWIDNIRNSVLFDIERDLRCRGLESSINKDNYTDSIANLIKEIKRSAIKQVTEWSDKKAQSLTSKRKLK